ncbi:MAG: carboxypeptidase regulatory-like domain-containing protein, partial [Bacteroidetes bacterium]|nr:carboxypeptidase regulatory-like domain-containing protein [Bacteroidota bacterium]
MSKKTYTNIIIVVLILLLGGTKSIHAQVIHGQVSDSSMSKKLAYASVVLINSKDSSLIAYTRSNSNGVFNLSVNNISTAQLYISYPDYADYFDLIKIGNSDTINLGKIEMYRNEMMLKNVVVIGKRKAIVIKGDTVEFTADSFINREGASVEDLLKKLPGLTVDKNGKVTAFGKT